KNASLAAGDRPEPMTRVIGEEQVVGEADRLVANTRAEAHDLRTSYGAPPERLVVVEPGVDLDRFRPAPAGRGEQVRRRARRAFGLPETGPVVTFVGRLQPLKAPDVLLRAAAELRRREPELAATLTVVVAGGPSGTGLEHPTALTELAGSLGISAQVRFLPPQPVAALPDLYRASDLVAVPSYNESFGLVALEAQACGTPVVAAEVGGLPVAVRHDVTGLLVPTHRADDWADALAAVALRPGRRARLSAGAYAHAAQFSWRVTTDKLLAAYAAGAAVSRPQATQAV